MAGTRVTVSPRLRSPTETESRVPSALACRRSARDFATMYSAPISAAEKTVAAVERRNSLCPQPGSTSECRNAALGEIGGRSSESGMLFGRRRMSGRTVVSFATESRFGGCTGTSCARSTGALPMSSTPYMSSCESRHMTLRRTASTAASTQAFGSRTMASISTRTSRGRPRTATVLRAGRLSPKCRA